MKSRFDQLVRVFVFTLSLASVALATPDVTASSSGPDSATAPSSVLDHKAMSTLPLTQPNDVELFIDVGFSHWFGETFGAPPGITTPALVIGVRPGISLLELRAHYTVSLTKFELPTNGDNSHVGFANLDVLFNRELRVAGERMILQFGPAAGFVHTSQGFGFAYGAVLGARYMIDLSKSVALGPFFDVRWQMYKLPHSGVALYEQEDGDLDAGRSDAQSQIGVALSFW